ncbi:MAG: hypothetical protein HZA35_03305 [Parcubacteria group bacterium]|nr:hypothetical protein [Parcubacteria group bacterium]
MKRNYFLFFILFLGLFFVYNYGVGYAQEDNGIGISPAIIEERVDPGQTLRSFLYVTNKTKETKTYYVSKMNMTGLTEKGDPEFDTNSEGARVTLSSWITVPTTLLVVSGLQIKEIPFSVQIPRNAPPGGHFAGIFVSTIPSEKGNNSIATGVQTGSIISLRVAGDVKEEAQVRNFYTDKIVYDVPEVTLTAKIENTGNTLVRPAGSIEIFDWFGKKVATLIINENGGAVLPRNLRAYATTWKGEGFVLGKYEAHLGLSYGDSAKKTVYTTLAFWVFPLKIVISLIVGIFIFAIIVFGGARAYVRRELHELRGERERSGGKKKKPFLRILIVNGGFVLGIIALLAALLLFF